MKAKLARGSLKGRGFTLIELIVGIVVLSISFSLLITLILPLSEKSAEQLHQVRAAELAQSMMNEILARAFDENSGMAGGLVRCGENSTVCTSPDNDDVPHLGADDGEFESGEAKHALFNDVDDYKDFDFTTDTNSSGDLFINLYPGFDVDIHVCYSKFDGICNDTSIEIAKLIIITVTTPQDFDFVFSFYMANF
jgi:MSHA pilin protein MshD